jgi:hypothetical protein
MTLKCSTTSLLHRLRNLLNSLPHDRDEKTFIEPKLQLIAARDHFLKHSYAAIRHGGIWAGPLMFKWKFKEWSIRPKAVLLNAQAFSDMRYKSRYVVVAPGFLRLFSSKNLSEASYRAAEGFEKLTSCNGWISVRGNCTSLRIGHATVMPGMTRRGVPCVIINECPRKDCASWKLSLCCFDWELRNSLVQVLCSAGCSEVKNPQLIGTSGQCNNRR